MAFLKLFSDEPKKTHCDYCSNLLSEFDVQGLDHDKEGRVLTACEECTKMNSGTIPASPSIPTAPSTKLPCKYAVFGCKKQFSTGGVLNHEKSCDYRIYQCVGVGCTWQGSPAEYKSHILMSHSEIIIKNGCFKIPTHNTECLNIIFAFDEIFLVKFHVTDSIFCLSVKWVGKLSEYTKFTYVVNLENRIGKSEPLQVYNGKMKPLLDVETLQEKTDIQFNLCSLEGIFKTQNINCFITIIEKAVKIDNKLKKKNDERVTNKETVEKSKKKKTPVEESENKKAEVEDSDNKKTNEESVNKKAVGKSKNKKKIKEPNAQSIRSSMDIPRESKDELKLKDPNENKKDTFSYTEKPSSSKQDQHTDGIMQKNLIQEFECPVCQEYMFPPISLCSLGHSICSDCKSRLSKCPTCQSSYGNTRNYSLENMIQLVHLACRNEIHGCDFIGTLSSLHEHKLNCDYDRVKCPIPSHCKWAGPIILLFIHLSNSHKDDGYIKPDQEITHDLKNSDSSHNLVRLGRNLFRVSCKAGKTGNSIVKWAFQTVLPSTSCKIEIEFIDQTDNQRKFIINNVFHKVTETDSIFEECLAIPLDLLQPYIDSQQLLHFKYRVY